MKNDRESADQLRAAFNAAVSAHRLGEAARALEIYRAILSIDAAHSQATHLAGFAAYQLSDYSIAVDYLARAVRLDPTNAQFLSHAAAAHLAHGEQSAAETLARKALLLAPPDAEPWITLARSAPSLASIKRARSTAPHLPAVWVLDGVAEEDKLSALKRAAVLAPGDIDPLLQLSRKYRQLRRPDLGAKAGRWGRVTSPGDYDVLTELGASAFEYDDVRIAFRTSRRAILLSPARVEAWTSLAQVHYRLDETSNALRYGKVAVLIAPDSEIVKANYGSYLLANGELEQGWDLFQNRVGRQAAADLYASNLPDWDQCSAGSLTVLAEQGLGDELLFATCLRDLQEQTKEIAGLDMHVQVDPRLISLFQRSFGGIDFEERGQKSAVRDHKLFMGDLAGMFRRTINQFPSDSAFLQPDPVKQEEWRRWLTQVSNGRQTVGLCWRSGLRTVDRQKHYPAIEDLRPLLARKDICFVLLQYDECEDELLWARTKLNCEIHRPPGINLKDDLNDVAAILSELDQIVGGDTAVIALAGALGAEALCYVITEGWVSLGTGSHPWFRSVTRFLKPVNEEWEETIERSLSAIAK